MQNEFVNVNISSVIVVIRSCTRIRPFLMTAPLPFLLRVLIVVPSCDRIILVYARSMHKSTYAMAIFFKIRDHVHVSLLLFCCYPLEPKSSTAFMFFLLAYHIYPSNIIIPQFISALCPYVLVL